MRSRVVLAICTALALSTSNFSLTPAFAGSVASGTSDPSSVCTQTVDVTTSVSVNKYGNDCVITFGRVGTTVWTVPAGVTKLSLLIVAGGGGGGFDVAGGGGAGGLLYYGGETPKTPNGDTLTVSSGSFTVVVGDGGTGATSLSTPLGSDATGRGVNGSDTTVTLPSGTVFTAKGGGAGNSRNNPSAAQTGGSGGGGGYGNGTPSNGGSGTGTGLTLQGYGGGKIVSGNQGGAGGGGAGAVGANWSDSVTDTGGGGNGLQYSISGTPTYYGGGGGGGSWANKGGPGGLGGGGNGGSMSAATCRSNCSTDVLAQTGNPGLSNTGGGGGGSGNASNSSPGGKGGSGVVIVRFTLILNATATISMASGQVMYRTPKTLSVVSSVTGKVDFFANGKAIPACRNVVANAGNSYTAQCSYSAAVHGSIAIKAVLKPSDAGFIGTTSSLAVFNVAKRAGTR